MREPLTIVERIFNPKLKGKLVMVRGLHANVKTATVQTYSGIIKSVGLDYIEIRDFNTGELRSVTLYDLSGKGGRYKWVKVFELGPRDEIKPEGDENDGPGQDDV